jgi:hypothetical protein
MMYFTTSSILTPEICSKHPNWLFVFGDNLARTGKKGQAIIRGCKNSIGIPTKKLPSLAESAFFSDVEYESNIGHIKRAIEKIKALSRGYKKVIFPKNIGRGLAKENIKAPKTYKFMIHEIKKLKPPKSNSGNI